MNKKRIILLLLITMLVMSKVNASNANEICIEFDVTWKFPTRAPLELPFDASMNEGRILSIHFISEGTFTLSVKDLNGRDVYVTTVTPVSGQDVFIDLKQLPSETYLLTLKNERLEATGYLIL